MTVEQLNEATIMKKRVLGSNLNPTGNLQDCLGMTPLHILACSTVQNIELYKGNYSQFEIIRAERMAEIQSNFIKQQKEVEHMQSFIRRFKANRN